MKPVDYPLETQNATPLEISQCHLLENGREVCWQNLCHILSTKLATVELELQQTISTYQWLKQEQQQLQEQLAESEAKQKALAEASATQARQFSETLKQLRQKQTQIIQAEKMSSLGQLVAGVAHEINNPMNFIQGNLHYTAEYVEDLLRLLELYQRHYPDPADEVKAKAEAIDVHFLLEDLPKLLNSMQVGANRIQKIVLSLRNFSRMDEAEVKEVDIHEGINSTLMILQNRLRVTPYRSAIEVVQDYGELPLVECSVGQLNQVFMHLISNAIDALDNDSITQEGNPESAETKSSQSCESSISTLDDHHGAKSMPNLTARQKPIITICTRLVSNHKVQISITDNGPGIPESVQKRLFDPFFTTKPVGEGTGLGLSISYQIITKKHRGTLQCISQPGQGTEFVINFPVHSCFSRRQDTART